MKFVKKQGLLHICLLIKQENFIIHLGVADAVFRKLIFSSLLLFFLNINGFFPLFLGDANNSTLSPMDENNHVIERNDKADLMTMSTPPHLLSAALMGNGSPEDGDTKPRRIQYNHRSEFFS